MIFNFNGSGGGGDGSVRYDAETDMVQIKDTNGNWHDWKTGNLKTLYLLKNGEVDLDLTGGITTFATRYEGSSYSADTSAVVFEFRDDYIYINANTTNKTATVRPNLPVDVTNYTKMYVEFKFITQITNGDTRIGMTNSIENNYPLSALTLVPVGTKSDIPIVYEVNISALTGIYYPFICPMKDKAEFGVSNIYFK